jgi:hypothetical protein
MSKDFLSYDRTVKAKEVLSSDFATISFGSEKAKLVQSVRGSYGHKVQPLYEAGSSALYWLNGQPNGQLGMGRVVGSKGWFYYFNNANVACALLEPITIKLDGDFCDLSTENDTIKLEDSILERVTFSYSAGDLMISENAEMRVSKITVSGS